MANKLIDSFGIPLSLKVGLINDVKINFSVLSFWTSPLELVVNDMYLVLGPSTFFRSNDESYIEENQADLLNASYDSTNAFNIFEHEMKIKQTASEAFDADPEKKEFENLKFLANSEFIKERLNDEEKQVQNVRMIFRNLRLNIQRLHIRYEDDYYSRFLGKKFAFGITIEQLFVQTCKESWEMEMNKDIFSN
jgi:hypothetical protein